MLLAIEVKLDGEDEQDKKKEKKNCLGEIMVKDRLRTSACQDIFQELRLKDKEGTPT